MPELTERNRLARRQRVGASEVGALLDPHPYTTPGRIYDRIVNDRGVDQTQVMRVGSLLEGPVAKAWGWINSKTVRANRRTYLSPVTAWLAATPDYFVSAEHALLEVKLTGDRWDDIPPHVVWQVRAQLHCTNRDLAYVAVANGSQLRSFEVSRDLYAEDEMLSAVERFGAEYIEPRIPPPYDAEPREVLLRVYGPSLAGGTITADEDMEQWASAIMELQQLQRELGPLADEARAGLTRRLVEAGALNVIGRGWRAALEGSPPSRLVVRA